MSYLWSASLISDATVSTEMTLICIVLVPFVSETKGCSVAVNEPSHFSTIVYSRLEFSYLDTERTPNTNSDATSSLVPIVSLVALIIIGRVTHYPMIFLVF